jgi:hypothetical protein
MENQSVPKGQPEGSKGSSECTKVVNRRYQKDNQKVPKGQPKGSKGYSEGTKGATKMFKRANRRYQWW